MQLSVLFQDEHLVAIDKPAGILVHRSRIDVQSSVFVLQTLRNQLGRRVYPIHRLDKPTSGVLLFALDPETASRVGTDFSERRVTKKYIAIVRGWTDDIGVIDYPLKVIRDRTTDGDKEIDKPAQEAISRYKTISRCELDSEVGRYETARYSMVEIAPETGRKNQIRRHFKHIFHPIIGDRKFGDRDHNAFFKQHLHSHRLMLFATELVVTHPIHGEHLQIKAPFQPGEDLLRLFDVGD